MRTTNLANGATRLALLLSTLAMPLLGCGSTPADATSGESVTALGAGSTYRPANGGSMCMDVSYASRDNGSRLQIWNCNGGDQQQWDYSGGMLHVYGNKCLDVVEGVNQNGTRLQIWDCTPGNTNQQFVRNGNTWVWANHNKCIDLPWGSAAAGNFLQVWDCVGNANQQWNQSGGSAPAPAPAPAPPPPSSGWNLVWADEFNGNSIDQGKWNYEVNCDGGGNNEQQCYTNSGANSYVQDGHLVIKVIKQNYNGKPYTSARLNSNNKGDWTYGRFESRAKVPCGQGFWPAVWMLPTDWKYGSWPTSGELDIMEVLGGQPNALFGTAHFGAAWPNNRHVGGQYNMPNGNFCGDYHEFAIERAADHVEWFVDGKSYFTIRPGDQSWSPAPKWPFDERFHFILNVAMGGDWPGAPDGNIQQGEMDVDYVRAYVRQ